jgi:hypothetical protein
MKQTIFAVLLGAVLSFGIAAQMNQTPNVSGTWLIEYHDNNGKEVDTPIVSLMQSNGQLDGVFGNQHWKVKGAIAGNQVQFSFSPPQHPEIHVRYQGALDSPAKMHGTMASEVQSGNFAATRQW